MIRKELDHVGLNVADLEKSIAFYQDMFGFSVIEKWDSLKQAFIGANGIVLGLMEIPNYDYRTYTMAHLAFPCGKPDFPNVVTKVQSYGLEIVSGPKEQRGGETILFRDPSGNILEVCYPSITEWKASQT
ncbi:VOC family protein [Methylobacter sp. G7]|uniref:VOC family protein n=1 Tax=Methylobacter sp. G7 TaxID=3230117 RepID=UPI003D803F00